ncbi:Similar to tr/Q70JS6/Q70JS6 [Microcystis aeruginosa PCC 9808]|uniref:Similar to tr/Q70JS6/Q70JS6 n=1 Tax=Microcystis aeruginosa PCC 9808 TaxID=1160284 RepID=I4I3T2_MICAE|nr:Similar to tr/Q70JS6/Q70JS6 [Microcystis aeruginosa PCC 9808]
MEDNLQRFMNPREVIFEEMKRECLKMYVNGLGFQAIERVKNVHLLMSFNHI